jgi:hypothetical protein
MTSAAGPPLARAWPEPTNRPVPNDVSTDDRQQHHVQNHTYGTTDSNHLQMAAFEFTCEGRVGGVLCCSFDIEDLSIGAHGALWRHVEVWIPLEAFNNPPPNAVSVL